MARRELTVSGSITSALTLVLLVAVLRGVHVGVVVALIMLTLIAAVAFHVVVHELGHLVLAWLVRLPVLGVRMGAVHFGRRYELPDTSGHVVVAVSARNRLAPLRMSLITVAGPAANLALSFVFFLILIDEGAPGLLRIGSAIGALVGLAVGVGNLTPHRTKKGTKSDGLRLLGWIFRPGRELRSEPPRLIQPAASADRRRPLTRRQARLLVDDPDPDAAVRAALDLARWHDAADAPQVLRFLDRSDVPVDLRASIAVNYALLLGLSAMRRPAGSSAGVVAADAVRDLASVGWRLEPASVGASTAVAFGELLHGRAKEAYALLVAAGSSAASPEQRGRLLAVRAMAEIELGRSAAAAETLAAGYATNPDCPFLAIAEQRSTGSRRAGGPD